MSPNAAGAGIVDRALIAYARGLEHPAKIRALHWLIRRFTTGRLHVCYGGHAEISIDPTDYIGWAILRTGSYEPASLSLALRIVAATPGLFVDVGANFGWYSCAMAAIDGTRVVAIEPDCTNCATLRANLAAYPGATIVNIAAGAGFGTVRIRHRRSGNSGTVTIDPDRAVDGSGSDWVATVPLDELLSRIIVQPVRPALVKIDVEGFEPEVLAGLDFAGPFRPHNIIMEYEPAISTSAAWGGLAGVEAFFAERGYDTFDVYGHSLAASGELPEANIWARERAASP